MSRFVPKGMGWLPDLPDARDYTIGHEEVLRLLRPLKRSRRKLLPKKVDLRRDSEGEYFTPAQDQGALNSSCAFSVLSLVEYFERRGRGRTFEGSTLFLYKVSLNHTQSLRRAGGDLGADLRTTLKTLVHFGIPPEDHWPYAQESLDEQPSAFVYASARPFTGIRYFRLDKPNLDGSGTLTAVKSFLAAGFPVVFGFRVPGSLTRNADVPYRPHLDSTRGGQAVVAVGYDDEHPEGGESLLIRSSWGVTWGDAGYGWLPYRYVTDQLARDFWSIASLGWLDPSEFFRPSAVDGLREA